MFVLRSEKRLLMALAAIVLLLNVPYGHYVLYPFEIFSTWVHEMSHGMMAIALGGSIDWLKVFPDGSGLARTLGRGGRIAGAAVSSAGYLGTALFGALLLSARRLPKVGSRGLSLIGLLMLASTVLWVRNGFGLVAIPAIGLSLLVASRKLTEDSAGFLFALLAATCSLESLTSIRVLFAGQSFIVGGEAVQHTDATSVAEALFLPSWFWASSWMLTSVVLLFLGLRLGATRPLPDDAD
jgi:hypothetical protein